MSEATLLESRVDKIELHRERVQAQLRERERE